MTWLHQKQVEKKKNNLLSMEDRREKKKKGISVSANQLSGVWRRKRNSEKQLINR